MSDDCVPVEEIVIHSQRLTTVCNKCRQYEYQQQNENLHRAKNKWQRRKVHYVCLCIFSGEWTSSLPLPSPLPLLTENLISYQIRIYNHHSTSFAVHKNKHMRLYVLRLVAAAPQVTCTFSGRTLTQSASTSNKIVVVARFLLSSSAICLLSLLGCPKLIKMCEPRNGRMNECWRTIKRGETDK